MTAHDERCLALGRMLAKVAAQQLDRSPTDDELDFLTKNLPHTTLPDVVGTALHFRAEG